MDELTTFLSNPVVGVIGYTLSLIAAIIAIYQALAKGKALKAIEKLNLQVTTINEENNDLRLSINKTENNNEIIQGEKSQYFQDNSGSVNIDNRG
ncbi:MAG: cell division protein FtsL [Colwellia sp.]|jgi:cell division protein FtsL